MLTRSELEQFAEDEKAAGEMATKGGARPSLDAGTAGLAFGAGTFMLLFVFAAVALPDRESAFLPIALLTGAVGAAAYFIVGSGEKAWLRRHTEAFDEIRAERAHSAARWG